MKILLKRRAIIIALASILISITTLVAVNVFNSPGPITGAVNVISNPLRALASQIAGTFEGIYNSIYRYEQLNARYEALVGTITELERAERLSAELLAENARLNELLEFRARHTEFTDEPATVRDWSSSNWVSSFTINRGYQNSTIEVGNAVVTEQGVIIGRISEVNATESTVVTVLDTTFSLSVNIGEAQATVSLRGDFNYMRQGLMLLEFIEDDMLIMVGDRVATSGQGGTFPPGLPVGQIHELHENITGLGRYATVIPISDISTVRTVFVIVEFGEAGLDEY